MDQEQNSRVVSGGPLANTEEVNVQLFPRYYKTTTTILVSTANLPSPNGPRKFASTLARGTRHPNLLELEKSETMVDSQPEKEGVQGVQEEGEHRSVENLDRDQHDNFGEALKQLTCNESEREVSEGPQYAKQPYEKSLLAG
ncbi:hypothetical protein Tco_1377306 [Tanacetum coccineum]